MLLKLEKFFDRFADYVGYLCGVLMILMLLNVFVDVIMRYFLREGSIAFQELEWHLFAMVFLLGISYGIKEEAHVRVDVIYDNMPEKKKAYINLIGTLIFLIPFSLLIIHGSIPFVKEAYDLHEVSGDPGGLPYRWIIKSVIPISFILVVISSIGYIIKNINIIKRENAEISDDAGCEK